MRRMKLNLIVPAIALALSLPSFARTIQVDMKDASGRDVGSAALKRASKGIEIKLRLHDLPAGEHAIHMHQNAKCDPPDFKSAGPHFNPDGKKHGLDNPEGPHAGDMQNFIVDHTGKAKLTLRDPNVTLGKGANSVFSNGGTALVIHAKADDMKTDPSGNSGDRIACGVITNSK
jgi:Cu-Zn family superoxide dismutase